MHATPPGAVVETIRRETTERACPGCDARIDLGEYGLVVAATTVVCRTCGNPFRLSDLDRV